MRTPSCRINRLHSSTWSLLAQHRGMSAAGMGLTGSAFIATAPPPGNWLLVTEGVWQCLELLLHAATLHF